MSKILSAREIAPEIYRMQVQTPEIAKKALPGQFVIIRINEEGERVPLTIADFDREKGTLTIIFQKVGKTTHELSMITQGNELADVVGPLGKPSHIKNYGTAICVGGGIGAAPIYPIARALHQAGNHVITINGAKSRDFLILEEELKEVSDELLVTTDDGTQGRKGFVTEVLKELLDEKKIDIVFAIGPAIMMKFACKTTEPYKVKTVVSLNPIMVDGTGMCGACRVEVGGETKFCCADGPEFDGHAVDFDLLLSRQVMYLQEEKLAMEEFEKSPKPNIAGEKGTGNDLGAGGTNA